MNPKAEFYLPADAKCGPVKYLCVSAHADDTEIMAFHGIKTSLEREDTEFNAVIVTDGAGSSRTGKYKNVTDADMVRLRNAEQKAVAEKAHYAGVWFLNYESRHERMRELIDDLKEIIIKISPKVIYTHNICDSHRTHIMTVSALIAALKELKDVYCPESLFGMETWRDLDWLPEKNKLLFDVSCSNGLDAELLSMFESQTAGGKRYDLAAVARREANATFSASHAVDNFTKISYGMDLLPLVKEEIPMSLYAVRLIDAFANEVIHNVKEFEK